VIEVFRNKALVAAAVFLFTLSLCSPGWAGLSEGARLVPKGTVSIYEGSQKVGEISSEAPLPSGKILSSAERCGVRMAGLYVVAEENSRFGVTPGAGSTDLFVQEGRVWFALGSLQGTLTFSTPQESVSVESSVVNASAEPAVIKGYLSNDGGRMEIGVIDGGRLVVRNASGQQVIEPGKTVYLQHAQAKLDGGGPAAGGAGGATLGAALLLGSVTVGLGAAGVAMMGGFEGSDPGPTSPFKP